MPKILGVQPVAGNYGVFDMGTNEPIDGATFPTLAQALNHLIEIDTEQYNGLDFFEEPNEEDAARNTTQRTAALANVTEGDVGEIIEEDGSLT